MALTKVKSDMTDNVLRTDVTNQTLTADTVIRNSGMYKTAPIGMIALWATLLNSGIPAGWLVCDGATHNIATYPDLAAALGTAFGGNGTTTFGVPNMNASVPGTLPAGVYLIRASFPPK